MTSLGERLSPKRLAGVQRQKKREVKAGIVPGLFLPALWAAASLLSRSNENKYLSWKGEGHHYSNLLEENEKH